MWRGDETYCFRVKGGGAHDQCRVTGRGVKVQVPGSRCYELGVPKMPDFRPLIPKIPGGNELFSGGGAHDLFYVFLCKVSLCGLVLLYKVGLSGRASCFREGEKAYDLGVAGDAVPRVLGQRHLHLGGRMFREIDCTANSCVRFTVRA